MDNIAITSKGPYAGATMVAAVLAHVYNYKHINMSSVLIEAYAGVSGLDVKEVVDNKDAYRVRLQRFGDSSGFQVDPKWIGRCLVNWDCISPVVIEKVRTNEQAMALKARGFIVVELTVSMETRMARASAMGVSYDAFMKAFEHTCEKGIDPSLVSYSLDGEKRPAIIAHHLTTLQP